MKFSIVIPTFNRQNTLDYTLRTCLNQTDYTDYEIVVFDANSTPPTVVPDCVKLYRTEKQQSMCLDWNDAISHAKGDYIILFGCDDGILPYALKELDGVLTRMDNPPLLRYRRCYYTWEDDFFGEYSGELQISKGGSNRMMNSEKLIVTTANFKMDYTYLPMLYTSAIRRDLLEQLLERTGYYLHAQSPDIYSGMALASLVDKVPSIAKPMAINASSSKSTGVNNLNSEAGNQDISVDFHAMNEADGILIDERVPLDQHRTLSGVLLDSFYQICSKGLFDADKLSSNHDNPPAFDGRVLYDNASDVYKASLICERHLKDDEIKLEWKEW